MPTADCLEASDIEIAVSTIRRNVREITLRSAGFPPRSLRSRHRRIDSLRQRLCVIRIAGERLWPPSLSVIRRSAVRSNRLFYRDRRPTWFGHWVSQFFCWWARVGLPPRSWVSLNVRDRVSGRMRADAVVVPTVAGERYIVSMFGEISDWVQNLEAADGSAVISHGGSRHVHLERVPPEQRAPILREYVRVASSGRTHFPLPVASPLADFAAIAPLYPVYRIEPVSRRADVRS